MGKSSILYALAAVILLLAMSSCVDNTGAPTIVDILTDQTSPVARNTDVALSADVDGDVVEYRWTVTGGVLREADYHSAQKVTYPSIGVAPDGFDNIATLLQDAGLTYDSVPAGIVREADQISDYDVLFINSTDDIEILGGESVLSTWVYAGGSLYLSGKAADYLIELWPGDVKFPQANPYVVSTGADGEILDGRIIDDSCAATLNRTSVDITYSADDWPVITGTSSSVETLVTVDASPVLSSNLISILPPSIDPENLPVAVSFDYGDGMVLYTCFHTGDNITDLQEEILHYFAAKLASHNLEEASHGLLNNAGFFLKTEYAGFADSDKEISYVLQMSDIDDAYFVLNNPEGILKLDISGPGSSDADVSGPAPLTAVFQDVIDGVWLLTVTTVESTEHDTIPCLLTVGIKTEALQLITDKPSAIWHTPFETGEYAITLRVTDSDDRIDEKTLAVEVE
jgi:hypothetical protein